MIRPLTLDVLVVTHGPEGIGRVAAMNPPQIPGVSYVVSWQNHGGAAIPQSITGRDDFKVFRFDRKGVSANRNNAIEHSVADIYLIADDDLVYTRENIENVLLTLSDNPMVDYASFRYEGPDDKRYPAEACDISTPPQGFYQTTFEIAIRRNSPAGQLRFNEQFGPGAPVLTAGEDEVFYLTARRMGLRMRFFPLTIARHPGLTTGSRAVTDPGVLRSSGAIIRLDYPATAFMRIPLKAWRLMRQGKAPFFRSLVEMVRGAVYSFKSVKI